jgi:hypothetical protein
MRVLVACEFSGIVRRAFRDRGHDAWSCDLLPAEDGETFWHLQENVLDVLRWASFDLMIAHPPCTYLTAAGARYWKEPERQRQRDEALAFFLKLYETPIPRIAIENPPGWPSTAFRKPDQMVDPCDFGEPERKRICLWLRGLPVLFPTKRVSAEPKGFCIRSDGRRYNYYFHQGKNGKSRSRFFPSVAAAMADQWGGLASLKQAEAA